MSTARSSVGPPGPAPARANGALRIRPAVDRVRAGLRGRLRGTSRPAPAAELAEQVRPSRQPPSVLSTVTDRHRRIVARCTPHTLVSPERLLATVDATEHAITHQVAGALVECGVWRGGSALAMVLALVDLDVRDRDLWLYDTFDGMTRPSEADTSSFHAPATDEWRAARAVGSVAYPELFGPGRFGLDAVRRLLLATGYPPERIHLVPGAVEQTVPEQAPGEVAVLRLDTDWYESTRHELEHLYPRLSPNGVLLVDDYGHWDGARRATEEYFANHPRPLLARTDYTGRLAVKRDVP